MEIIKNTREKCPLVHCITNYVTVNDVANIILACGGSPIMADDINEVKEMQSICNALVINVGTLNERTIKSMILAGKKANECSHIVVLDPVGVGATTLRNDTVAELLNSVKFDVIKGNISEIKMVALGVGKTNGVDACEADKVTMENLDEVIRFAKDLSNKTGAIIAITGPIDVITDGTNSYITFNGDKKMGKITGTGCMLAGVIASYVAANLDKKLEATVMAVAGIGLCGEKALEYAKGTGTLHIGLIDEMSNLDDKALLEGAKVEKR